MLWLAHFNLYVSVIATQYPFKAVRELTFTLLGATWNELYGRNIVERHPRKQAPRRGSLKRSGILMAFISWEYYVLVYFAKL
mmetsp:Transcript_36618/g.76837  ORF Transcript_36618/g.76837 Transcript_36618/m.76837 type:complete len:82 (-) Transcript_36618:275-520(-)